MNYAEVTDMKTEAQIKMLRDLCKKIMETSDDWLEQNAEELLSGIIDVLDNQSQEDAWGTEGWEHFFGYE